MEVNLTFNDREIDVLRRLAYTKKECDDERVKWEKILKEKADDLFYFCIEEPWIFLH